MLSLLHNNFVISALVSLILVGFIVSQNKNKEEKPGIVFYMRCFALSFILLLVVLYFKTGDLSLPSLQQSGGALPSGLPLNPTSTTVTTPLRSSLSNTSGDTIGTQLGLQNVDLGGPNF